MVEIYRGEKIFTSQAWQQIGWSGLLRHTGGYFLTPQAWQQTSWGGLVRYTGERNLLSPKPGSNQSEWSVGMYRWEKILDPQAWQQTSYIYIYTGGREFWTPRPGSRLVSVIL